MKLKVDALNDYKIEYKQSKPWRLIVKVNELRKGIPTGRSWSEPFDPKVGDIVELSARFDKRIRSEIQVDVEGLLLRKMVENGIDSPVMALIKSRVKDEINANKLRNRVRDFFRHWRKKEE